MIGELARKGNGWVKGFVYDVKRHKESDDFLNSIGLASVPDEGGVATSQSWGTYQPLVQDQDIRNSCTAEMGAGWVHALTGVECSTWVAWADARLLDNPGQPLRNVGVSLDGFVTALERGGMSPVRGEDGSILCPLDYPAEETLDDPKAAIPPRVARDAAQGYNLDVVQLFTYGERSVAGLVAALAQGFEGGIVIESDAAYRYPKLVGGEAFAGDALNDGSGKHAIKLDRYRKRASGLFEFRNITSYGFSHGVNGELWIPQSRVETAPFVGFAKGCS